MSRPRLLDLFCGAGGAGVGYHRAGFDVVGVDHVAQPAYPFEFIRYDISNPDFEFDFDLFAFDAVHASPPCKLFTPLRHVTESRFPSLFPQHTDLLGPTLERFSDGGRLDHGVPWVIENVPGAPLPSPITLCGSMFGLRCPPASAVHQ